MTKNATASTRDPVPTRPGFVSPLVKADELAGYLGISPRSVRRLAAEGRIPKPLRFGGSPRWNRKEVEQWVWAGCPATPRRR